MIDRENLKREMREHREAIARRQIAIDRELALPFGFVDNPPPVEEIRYSQPIFTPLPSQTCAKSAIEGETPSDLPTPDADIELLIDAAAQAIAESRDEMRREFEPEMAALRDRVSKLEGALATFTALLGGSKPAARRKTDKSASPLRLIRPDDGAA